VKQAAQRDVRGQEAEAMIAVAADTVREYHGRR